MTFLKNLAYSGVHFAINPSHRRSILLSNLVSLVLFCFGWILFFAYLGWYGWGSVAVQIPAVATLCLAALPLNRMNHSVLSRLWLIFMVPVCTMAVSINAKIEYYQFQEELDYFSFRFILLATCMFPPLFFSFRERAMLLSSTLLTAAILLMHDPLHSLFGVPYRQDVLKESNYSFTNVVVFVTWCIMMGGVLFLKWISEKSEQRAEALIRELNQINEELSEKNLEIEAQNQEISAQSENLNISQQRLQEAYELIADQKNQLVHQNRNLSSELVDINRDLTATNTELIKHNNELRQFSYTVSHNLRGPVASLMGLINLIDQKNFSSENQEIFNHVKTSIGRLDGIIGDLSKIIDIRHDIFSIRQKINLQTEVEDIRRCFQKDLEALGITLKTDFSKCPELYSVRPMVHSILYNLVSNAMKYRAQSRPAEIEISSSIGKYYVLSVRDNGLGIDLKNHRSHLFRLYKRFHFHTEGKGLGLYLVKLQSEALGGYVNVESEVDRGTTFTVYLGQPENVERQILYKEPYAVIFFDAKINATGIIWKGPLSSQQYRTAFLKCLEFVKVYNTPNYITDLSQQGYISREDQLWMFQEILPEAAQYGLRNIGIVRPEKQDLTVAQYLNGIDETLRRLGLQQRYFSGIHEAGAWLEKENEKNSAMLSL